MLRQVNTKPRYKPNSEVLDPSINKVSAILTLSKRKNFRFLHTERVCKISFNCFQHHLNHFMATSYTTHVSVLGLDYRKRLAYDYIHKNQCSVRLKPFMFKNIFHFKSQQQFISIYSNSKNVESTYDTVYWFISVSPHRNVFE